MEKHISLKKRMAHFLKKLESFCQFIWSASFQKSESKWVGNLKEDVVIKIFSHGEMAFSMAHDINSRGIF